MEARNYDYLYPEEYNSDINVRPRVLKKERRYIKVKNRTKVRERTNKKSLVFLGALNIVLSICLLYTYVTSTVLTGKISNIKSEIEDLEATRDYYSMEIDKYSSAERIEEIAKYKLGMVYPNEDQFFYISKDNKVDNKNKTSLAVNNNEK
ncbi:septum formation initiator family protein [Lagierella massiliensis]|uniref:septum formation initiator family protein n=1 Tax=Lagierella massiliensis TaxID=1689303 RepID=UPI0006D7A5B0|nr:cell division protein FtsL [Lagierella massiliensis]